MIATIGCAADTHSPGSDRELPVVESELQLGAQGDEVRSLHDYLTRYGYFPNEELQEKYPRWRPIVSEPPAYSDQFDERSESAVRALQQQMGLPVTGTVDEATREVLRAHRCSHPDGMTPIDPAQKWALYPPSWIAPWWRGGTITWQLSGTASDIGQSLVSAEITKAFTTWSNETNLTFQKQSSGAFLKLSFGPLPPRTPAATLAIAYPPQEGGNYELIFDNTENWGLNNGFADGVDVQSIALHEIGHLIGLDHTSVWGMVMFPNFVQGSIKRSLGYDDAVGVSVRHDYFEPRLSGSYYRDVAPHGGGAWVLSNTVKAGGYPIHKWTGSAWETPSGNGAVRIAVTAAGKPWVVDTANAIRRRTSASGISGSWQSMPGCAIDIAAGYFPEDVWAVGCEGAAYQWSEEGFTWIYRGGTNLKRIAVDRAGDAWGVQTNGLIWRLKKPQNNPNAAWENVPGCAIDIGAYFATWVVGCEGSAFNGGYEIYVWNEQIRFFPAIERAEWIRAASNGLQIGVGSQGPWYINASGQVLQQMKPSLGLL